MDRVNKRYKRDKRTSSRAQSVLRRCIEALEPRQLLATIYVDLNAPGPVHDGSSWDTAYVDLQDALTAAVAGSGSSILVADGTYKPTARTTPSDPRSATFSLKNGVGIYGGYAGASDPNAARDVAVYPTIFSGDIGNVGSNSDNAYHVLRGSSTDSTAVLDGCTITGGNATGSSDSNGGGIYISAGSPSIRNCTFIANAASSYGGGIYDPSSSPSLANCTLVANSANAGGGMYNFSASSPTLANCDFRGNTASFGGGGLYNAHACAPTLTNCTFSTNSVSPGTGGGMYNDSTSPTLNNCIFVANAIISTGWYGAGIYCSVSR
jgi:hypothetical protein